ncbi:unnamed protein product [Clonostachys rosea f. rosea IK726]|uniref:Aminotransferase class I/classII large domain-containing protein n=2 Tax=Bionectria ochroleuca TaxID=29856 RepID=A0A0B7KFH2_BIOOC|nr:unnamed protein product [Clonostachys rosea f. rosea IK726]
MSAFVTEWAKAQGQKVAHSKSTPVFYRNLEAELDVRRKQGSLMRPHVKEGITDFSSGDSLGLLSSGALKDAFLEEFKDLPNGRMTIPGSRLSDGNSKYLEELEKEIAEFHNAETALVVNSGCVANMAIFSTIPLAGDAILYDELVHASIHDGMKNSVARCQKSFLHNDVDSFSDTLQSIAESEPQIRNGTRSVIISVESVYSMDGDICILQELIDAAKEILTHDNALFIIDEAYGTGILGPKGSGLVSELGLEKEVGIRLHTFPKALGSTGSAILANDTVKMMLMNNARSLLFTGVPSFPMLASIRAAYQLLRSGSTIEGDDDPEVVSQILPIWTRAKHNLYLAFHVNQAGYSGYPVVFPVVPKGQERVRFLFQAAQTDDHVKAFADCICSWAEEMIEIEDSGDLNRLPTAARDAYAIMSEIENNSK